MLSRVAERVYWTARYLERVENIARLVAVYANMLLDMPSGISLSWYNLVTLSGSRELFEKHYKNRDERNVIKFLIADQFNSSSMLSCINMARENVRTTRDALPSETWEYINGLHLYAQEHINRGINRRHRYEFLNEVITGCQQINGLLSGAMTHGDGWLFLRLGRDLERADMTTRILDAGALTRAQAEAEELAPLQRTVWMNVLKSLSADQAYRLAVQVKISGKDVARFLLEDTAFPRSVGFCLVHMANSVTRLPNNEGPAKVLEKLRRQAFKKIDYEDLGPPFHASLDQLQVAIAEVHGSIAETWFYS